MTVISEVIIVKTAQEMDIVDLTSQIQQAVTQKKMKNGILTVFVAGSTAAITAIEYEPGLIKDLPLALDQMIPKNMHYHHEDTWHDGNGHSHIRASIIGQSYICPIINQKLVLGTWQQIVLLECDIQPRTRDIYLQYVGE